MKSPATGGRDGAAGGAGTAGADGAGEADGLLSAMTGGAAGAGRAAFGCGLEAIHGVDRVGLVAVEEMLGVEQRFAAFGDEMAD